MHVRVPLEGRLSGGERHPFPKRVVGQGVTNFLSQLFDAVIGHYLFAGHEIIGQVLSLFHGLGYTDPRDLE